MMFPTRPNRNEMILGSIYLVIDLFVLPWLLGAVNALLDTPLSHAQVNFLYFLINFAAILPIFRKFLLQSLKDAGRVLIPTLWYAVLGYLGYNFLSSLLLGGILLVYPKFANINDLSVALTLREDFALMAVSTVLLVPIAEETLFRGLVFRGLFDRSPVAAYALSMAGFAAVHVMGYIGSVEPALLLLSFIQYLPAGYCLCFAYRQSGTIFSPILMHMLVNALGVFSMR